MKIYISADLEGVSGLTGGWSEISPGCREFEFAKEMLTEDINACIRGCIAAGADRIVVHDRHGAGLSVNVEQLDRHATLVMGRYVGFLPLLDESYDAMIILGQHGMEGRNRALMNSTAFGGIRTWINGREVGEFGYLSAMAADMGVPTVMVTGDTEMIEEAREFIPEIYGAGVKNSMSRYSCEIIPPAEARALIEKTAAEALGNIGRVSMYRPEMPRELKVEYTSGTQLVDWMSLRPGIRRVNGQTLVYTSNSLKEAFSMLYYIAWFNIGDKPQL